MKKIKSVILILVSILIFSGCGEDITINQPAGQKMDLSTKEQSLLKSSETFGLKLFRKINEADRNKNLFVSPLSISIALGMALNGAEGTTYTEMLRVLELNGLSLSGINNANKTLLEALTKIDPKVKFEFANSCWYDNNFQIEQNFIDELKKYYLAEVQKVNMNDVLTLTMINKWVKDKTYGKIDQILDEIPGNVVMYLINALYFKADWKYVFKESDTLKKDFTLSNGSLVQTDMMKLDGTFPFYSDNDIKVIDLPYGDSTFAMTVIYPEDNNSADNIIAGLNDSYWNQIVSGFLKSEILLHLPKFKYKYDIELRKVLESLGMLKAFTGEAEFTKIRKSGGILISRILHKSFIEVNEKGTEAAAVTAVEFRETSLGGKVYMEVNRPFVYVIRELSSNSIIFIGKVENPVTQQR